jgi:hypothetical protein
MLALKSKGEHYAIYERNTFCLNQLKTICSRNPKDLTPFQVNYCKVGLKNCPAIKISDE